MSDRLSDTALLQAVEVLMGQFSEQILALLEAHARGDVDSEAFEARIRELVGAVSPEAVARHPGRLTLVRPASPAPVLPEIPVEPTPATVSFTPGEEALPGLPAESAPAAEPPARAEAGPSGAQPPPAGDASGFPGQFGSGFEVEFEPEFPESLPEAPPDQALAEFVPAAEDGVAPGPIPALDLPRAEPGPEFPQPDELPAEEGGVAGSDRLHGGEPAPPAPEIILPEPESASLEMPAILDGVSGFEPLPEFELDGAPAEPAPPAPEPVILAEPDAAPAPPAPEIFLLEPDPASSEGPAILDGVSGYEHLLEPEPTAEEPPPALAQARPTAAPRPVAPPGGPAQPPRPNKAPAKGVAVVSSIPSHTPGGRPTAPAKPIPPPQASAAQAKSPAAPAKTSPASSKSPPPPAKAPAAPAKPAATPAKAPAPQPRRPKASGMGGNVVVSGRLGSDDVKAPDRPGMGFGEQMFGNGGDAGQYVDQATSFMSRQVRRELQEKTTWKSPVKAALLSGLLPGVGDFYVGKVSTGLVFYLVFYILLMLLILRGDLVFVGVLAVLALTSSGVSWLSATKHNETIHRIQDAPSMQHKTRETTFTFDRTRRRR